MANRGAGPFCPVAGPKGRSAGAPTLGAVSSSLEREGGSGKGTAARPGATGVRANNWADREPGPSAPTPGKTPRAGVGSAVDAPKAAWDRPERGQRGPAGGLPTQSIDFKGAADSSVSNRGWAHFVQSPVGILT